MSVHRWLLLTVVFILLTNHPHCHVVNGATTTSPEFTVCPSEKLPRCLSCSGAASEAQCQADGYMTFCNPDELCYTYSKQDIQGNVIELDSGCRRVADCSSLMFSSPNGACISVDGSTDMECTYCESRVEKICHTFENSTVMMTTETTPNTTSSTGTASTTTDTTTATATTELAETQKTTELAETRKTTETSPSTTSTTDTSTATAATELAETRKTTETSPSTTSTTDTTTATATTELVETQETTETTMRTTHATDTTISDTSPATAALPLPDIIPPTFSGPYYVFNSTNGTQGSCVDYYYFTCRVNYAGPLTDNGSRFDVALTFDGQVDSTYKTTTPLELDVDFGPRDLRGHLGTNVSCAVRSYWEHLPSVTSDFVSSFDSFFAGTTYWTENGVNDGVRITEMTVSQSIHFKSSLPVICSEGSVTLQLSGHTGLTVSSCSVTFMASDPPQTEISIKVRAVQTPGANSRVVYIEFYNMSSSDNGSAWDGYQQPYIQVLIMDETTAGSCLSDGDPHIRTFDLAFYSVYFEGDFVMWRSTSNIPAEVHARFMQCQDLNVAVSCNCAVAFREGNNIVGVYACDPSQPPIAIQYLRDPHTAPPRVQIASDGLYFYITMPSGRAMSVSTFCLLCGRLTITLYAISEDAGHAEGLCGNYNGIADDDVILVGSMISESREEPIMFARSHIVSPERSYINGHIYYPDCLRPVPVIPTECQCGQVDQVNCAGVSAAIGQLGLAVTYTTLGTDRCLSARRKRDTIEIFMEYYVIYPYQLVQNFTQELPYAALYPNNTLGVALNESVAVDSCTKQLDEFTAHSECPGFTSTVVHGIVYSCVLDVVLTGDVDAIIRGIISKYGEACIRGIQVGDKCNISGEELYKKDNPGNSNNAGRSHVVEGQLTCNASRTQNEVASSLCNPDCTSNGTCNNSECVCNDGWTGPSCNITFLQPPVITGFIFGLNNCRNEDLCQDITCDNTATEGQCKVFFCDVQHSDKTQCTTVSVFMAADTHSGYNTIIASRSVRGNATIYPPVASQATSVQWKFNLPISPVDSQSTTPYYLWNVSFSNNNYTFSKSLWFLVFDSVCLKCSETELTCQQKNGTCLIDGHCRASDEKDKRDSCFACLPANSSSTWTRGWVGSACDHSVHQPPVITQMQLAGQFYDPIQNWTAQCDVRIPGSDCLRVVLFMEDKTFTLSALTCKLRLINATHYPTVHPGLGSSAVINLPEYALDSNSASPNYTWSVSVSNDNASFTDELQILVFDSKCMDCSNETGACQQKNESCVIDGKCYSANEAMSDYGDLRCFECLPDNSRSTWTREWVGDTCVYPIGDPPVVLDVTLGSRTCDLSDTSTGCGPTVCDVRVPAADCTSVVISVTRGSYSDYIHCRCVSATSTYYLLTNMTTAMKLWFSLPVSPLDTRPSSPYYTWNVSFSNDNKTFGDQVLLVVFDSNCTECSDTTGVCQQKNGTCIIDGKCHAEGEVNSANPAYKCSPEISNSNWTDIDECASNPCVNAVSCTDLVNGYVCTCVSGFSGSTCETALTTATSSSSSTTTTTTAAAATYVASTAPTKSITQTSVTVRQSTWNVGPSVTTHSLSTSSAPLTTASTQAKTSTRVSTTQPSTLPPSWGPWSSVNPCVPGCDDTRTTTRTRSCLYGDACVGDSSETLNCLTANCSARSADGGIGAIATIQGVSQFTDTFVADLFKAAVDAFNKYCTKNSTNCCRRLLPGVSINPVNQPMQIATLSRVRMGSGYPQPTGKNSATVQLLFWATRSHLYTQCVVGAIRKKRQADNTIVYLDKYLVADALNDGIADIQKATSSTITEFVPNPDATTTNPIEATSIEIPQSTTDNPRIIIIITSTVGSVVLVLLLVVVFIVCIRKNKNKSGAPKLPATVPRRVGYAPRGYYRNRPPYYLNR